MGQAPAVAVLKNPVAVSVSLVLLYVIISYSAPSHHLPSWERELWGRKDNLG